MALSFVVEPAWFTGWRASLSGLIYPPLILRWGGVVLLAAVTRWRHPEARVLLAMGCLPVSSALYEALPCFLVPRRRREAYLLAVLTLMAGFLQAWIDPPPDLSQPVPVQVRASLGARWPVMLGLVYVPALILLLRRPRQPPVSGHLAPPESEP